MTGELQVTTFYGTDGCGKSTIAREFTRQAAERTGEKARIIGGSSYKEWLTRKVARSVFGSAKFLDEPANTPLQKRRLYENIAVTTYGFADKLRENGQIVAIDSDPFLKRLVWSGLELPDQEERLAYIAAFEARLADIIGADTAPKNVVGVNVDKSGSADLLTRIQKRGGVSEFDPSSEGEMLQMNEAILELWGELTQVSLGNAGGLPGIERRFGDAKIIELSNPDCDPEKIIDQTNDIARAALEWVFSKNL